MRGISIEIDRLTRSIEDVQTGERYETVLIRLLPEDISQIKKSHWLFDWKAEVGMPGREVYKLCRIGESKVVQGLVSFENLKGHIFLHLVESAKFNRGKSKLYEGVPGNLFAYACKRSLELGHEGCVAFISKTVLIQHYVSTLGAAIWRGQRLYIDETAAQNLIKRYFDEE